MSQVKVRRVVEQEVDIPDLGGRLRDARIEVQAMKGVSLTKVCKAAQISRNYWYQIEAENIQGALMEDTLRRIEFALSEALGRTVDLGVRFHD